MSEYIMAPGARLDIGPGGKPFESMGACCAGCSKPSLGALATEAELARAGQSTSTPSSFTSSPMLPYLVVAGAGVLGVVMYLRRRKRR